jgi:GNAT superfamily N-acetyltransferase
MNSSDNTNTGIFICKGRKGKEFHFKPIAAADKEQIRAGFKLLSPRSVYNRFFTHLKHLSEEQLDQLAQADQINHVAWAAFDPQEGEPKGVGIGRFVRAHNDPTQAEMALTVIDQYHSMGVGTILLAILYHRAWQTDIEHLTGVALSHNEPLVLRFKKLGAHISLTKSEYYIDLPIYEEPKSDNAYSNVFRDILKHIKKSNFTIN